MIYPTPNRYRDKIKANINNINDTFLQKGEVIKGSIMNGKYPYILSGTCAAVFKIRVGTKFFALRCWTKELLGLEKRFREIDNYLKTISLPYFVDFSFNKNGFKGDNNDFFPTLRMEWVDGCTLTDFVIKNCNNKTKIKNVAQQFLEMVQTLHANNISHGDLQGGNIMVKQNGNICLIDYDSICTPNLQNEKNYIAGLAGFQHPLNKKSLGLEVDYFSELVIYLSLLIFSENQNLAKNIDDKKWLFSESDLKSPTSSPIFNKLMTMSADVQNLTKHLIDYCKTDASKLQPLENIIDKSNNSPWEKTFSKRVATVQTNDINEENTTSIWNTHSKNKTTSTNKQDNTTNDWNTFSKQTNNQMSSSLNKNTSNVWGNTFSKFCNKCGKANNKPTSNFCSNCGKKRN